MAQVSDQEIKELQERLLEWYKVNGRKFPWRKSGLSNYQLVIAEVLLQRTKAETVSKFYSQFIFDFPSWKSLANAEQHEIEEYLKPIGLYRQRAARLKKLSVEMVKRNGRLPQDRKELESIPFMGQYIANAVELTVFNQPSPLVDVNMARIIERYFGPRKLADIRYDPYLQETAYRIVNHEKAKFINWAILDYAAKICTARYPKHGVCIFASECCYYNTNESIL